MHEFALAEGVAVTAVEAARKEGLQRITRLTVGIGELQQIERELFTGALREVMPAVHPQLAGVELELIVRPARLRCRACGQPFDLQAGNSELTEDQAEAIHFVPELAHTYLRCPACGSPDFEVREGRGVWLEEIEGT